MKKKLFSGALALLALSFLLLAVPASASGTTLSLTASNDGDSVQIRVTGAASSSVIMSYLKNGYSQLNVLGTTDSNGVLSTIVSTAVLGVSPNSSVYVTVGGVNGVQSPTVAWPSNASGNMGLDKTSLVMTLNQSVVITAYNNGSNRIYLSGNSNPMVANANISGNQITVIGVNYGSTVITICSQANSLSCASAYVSIQNTGSAPLAFSQNYVGLAAGQTVAVNVYGGTGTYVLTNNSNSSIISASLSGTALNLTAGASSGYTSVTVCSADLSACGIVNVHIGTSTSSALTLGQANTTLSIAQNLSIGVSGGGSTSYFLLSDSDTDAVSASVSGHTLSLTGVAAGSANVVVCSSQGSCNSVLATVIGNAASGGPITLSQNNLWLTANQTLSLTVSGGTTPYSVIPGDNSIATSTVSNSILTVTGVSAGSTNIVVCSAGGGCTNLAVLINGTGTNPAANFSLSPSQVYANSTSTNYSVTITGNGSYYISGNTNSAVAAAVLSGSRIIITPVGSGTSTLSICQNGGQCANETVSVTLTPPAAASSGNNNNSDNESNENGAANALPVGIANNTLVRDPGGKIYYVSNNSKQRISSLAELRSNYAGWKIQDISAAVANQIPTVASVFKFSGNLAYGARGQAVTELQKKLKNLKLYSGPIDGHYTVSVVAAVRAYQKSKNIRQTGNVGPLTAASLNK